MARHRRWWPPLWGGGGVGGGRIRPMIAGGRTAGLARLSWQAKSQMGL